MMNASPSTDARMLRGERGDALIEAIVGILLMTIVGLGLSYAAARALNSQRYQSTHNLMIAEMRNVLASQGLTNLCAGNVTVPNGSLLGKALPTPTCTQASVSVGVAGSTQLNVTLPAGKVVTSLRLSTPRDDATIGLFGGDGSIVFSQ